MSANADVVATRAARAGLTLPAAMVHELAIAARQTSPASAIEGMEIPSRWTEIPSRLGQRRLHPRLGFRARPTSKSALRCELPGYRGLSGTTEPSRRWSGTVLPLIIPRLTWRVRQRREYFGCRTNLATSHRP
jgi:hypothetical protein